MATSSRPRPRFYDRQGRLHQVVEPIGPTGSTTTTYEYDAGNRLKKVSMADGTTTQVREFVYDGRGFLEYEKHPEKGVSGNGTVDYADYDARGHVGQTTDGTTAAGKKVLVFLYDRAERLEEVRESSDAGPVLKEFTYGSSGLSNGKLESATRHNYLSEFNDVDLRIREIFTYAGLGGRVSRRETHRSNVEKDGVVSLPFEKWFETDFTWTELGEIASIAYPTCTIPTECTASGNPSGQPARIVSYGWVNGFLKTVDFLETANTDPDVEATVSYHPNEMLESVAFSYFDEMSQSIQPAATTHWDKDQNSMRRPARIYTSGVTGGSNLDTGIYAYDGAGNVKSMSLAPLSDTFAYDGASRLVAGTAGLGAHVESSAYDAFGNRVAADTPELGYRAIPVDPATNRLLGTVERPVAYDERGNQKRWGTAVYTYDGFNQMILQKDSGSGADFSYVYTADDERIAVVNNAVPTETWYLRDLDGLVLRKFYRTTAPSVSWQKDTIHRQGQVLATDGLAAGVEHAHLDHLGTIRLWTDRTGASPKHLTYSAFGEEIGDNAVNRDHQFTGHERDRLRSGGCTDDLRLDNKEIDTGQTFEVCGELSSTNTTVTSTEAVRFRAGDAISLNEFTIAPGAVFVAEIASGLSSALQDLDYMHARYCSPVQGRFLSVDPRLRRLSTGRPLRWNRYSYVANNPIKYVDPNGEDLTIVYDFSGSGLALREQALVVQGVRNVFRQAGVRNVVSLFPSSSIRPRIEKASDRLSRVKVVSDVIKKPGNRRPLAKTRGNMTTISTAQAPAGDSGRVNFLINVTSHEVGHTTGALPKYDNDGFPLGTQINPEGAQAGTIMEQGVPPEILGIRVRAFSEEDAERLREELNDEIRPPTP